MVINKNESQKLYYQRQIANNRDEFLKKRREINARYYKKTFKNEEINKEKEINKDEDVNKQEEKDVNKDDEINKDEDVNKQEKINKDEDVNKQEDFIILNDLKKRLNPINKSILKEQTKHLYYKSFHNIYKHFKNKDIDYILKEEIYNILSNNKYNFLLINKELDFLKYHLFDIIKFSNKGDIRNLYSFLTRIKSFSNIIKQLYPYIDQNQKEYEIKRKNKIIDINIQKKIQNLSFNKNDILIILNDTNINLTIREKLIFTLFTLFPTRRAIDYNRMLISKEKPKTEYNIKLENRNNYYYNGTFYFNITKNKQIQYYKIIEELKEIIEKEINERNDIDDNHLLLNNKNKHYKSNELSFTIMKIYKKIYGIAISAVEIRRLYSTYLKNQVIKKELTNEEHKKIAEMMNHSYEENQKYSY